MLNCYAFQRHQFILMWIPFQTTNFRNDSEIGAKEFHLHA